MMERRRDQHVLREAGLGDQLSHCPFCDFAIILENEQERVFRCLNSECLKASCR
jgi:TRIAD3 protein (E3 ubiquitin-protein ligase RNF216)